MRNYLACAAVLAAVTAAPVSAAQYLFSFSGQGRTGTGVLTTSDTPSAAARGGYTAFAITSITGSLTVGTSAPLTITGLNGYTGSDNLYYTTGPSFLDGSGLGFTTTGGGQSSLFYSDVISSYRITTVAGGFAAGAVTASSSAVAAVPEPAGWAMMIAGFAAVGVATRRRQRAGTAVRFA